MGLDLLPDFKFQILVNQWCTHRPHSCKHVFPPDSPCALCLPEVSRNEPFLSLQESKLLETHEAGKLFQSRRSFVSMCCTLIIHLQPVSLLSSIVSACRNDTSFISLPAWGFKIHCCAKTLPELANPNCQRVVAPGTSAACDIQSLKVGTHWNRLKPN